METRSSSGLNTFPAEGSIVCKTSMTNIQTMKSFCTRDQLMKISLKNEEAVSILKLCSHLLKVAVIATEG